MASPFESHGAHSENNPQLRTSQTHDGPQSRTVGRGNGAAENTFGNLFLEGRSSICLRVDRGMMGHYFRHSRASDRVWHRIQINGK